MKPKLTRFVTSYSISAVVWASAIAISVFAPAPTPAIFGILWATIVVVVAHRQREKTEMREWFLDQTGKSKTVRVIPRHAPAVQGVITLVGYAYVVIQKEDLVTVTMDFEDITDYEDTSEGFNPISEDTSLHENGKQAYPLTYE